MTRDVHEILGELVDQVVPGGCDNGDGEQVVERDPVEPRIYHLKVRHDDDCPAYRRMRAAGHAQ